LPEQLRRLPFVVGRPLPRRRHILRVAERRTAINPLSDRSDLVVTQRHVVLELLDADRLVDVPRRHLSRRHALLDRPRPRTRLFVSKERHRRNRSRTMTVLTFCLEDRGNVLCERRAACSLYVDSSGREHEACREREHARGGHDRFPALRLDAEWLHGCPFQHIINCVSLRLCFPPGNALFPPISRFSTCGPAPARP